MDGSTVTWMRRVSALAAALLLLSGDAGDAGAQAARRPVVGLALGGGSAKGIAHVGVLRWMTEHRIPIDRIAGTSMGGLVAGAYASGMTPAALDSLLRATDWNETFGASAYRFYDVARKEDARAYPSRLELHLGNGLALPPSLNRGMQVDLLLRRITGLYTGLESFDLLPTPFRCVAVDLRTSSAVVLGRGSLPTAMRATMSIPGVFPPVEIDSMVLVDGGAMNNLPADVVREMGADVVIAVRVGPVVDTADVRSGILAMAGQTGEAMMRANTRRSVTHADVVIRAAETFTGDDWRQAGDLVEDGYRAAEAMEEKLLPYAVDEAEWARYLAAREARRRAPAPVVARVDVRGAEPGDEGRIRRRLRHHAGRPLDVGRLDHDLTRLGGLDRYATFWWSVDPSGDGNVLVVDAHSLASAPPFLMTSVNVRNRAHDDYSFQLALRYLGYDVVGHGSQLRVDLALGSDRSAAVELRRALAGGPVFVALGGMAETGRADVFVDDDAVARYRERRVFGQLDLGVVAGHDAEVRVGLRGGHYDGSVAIGDPGLPELSGGWAELHLRAVRDTRNSAVVPSRGTRFELTARHVLQSPEPDVDLAFDRSSDGLTQAEASLSAFTSWKDASRRLFVVAGGGTSFDGDPLLPDRFVLGLPMRLDAFAEGQRRGDHYAFLTGGYLQELARLPDFLGGPVLAGAWVENGSAFDALDDAKYEVQLGAGVIAETLIGPIWVGYAAGPDAHRLQVGIGRLFP